MATHAASPSRPIAFAIAAMTAFSILTTTTSGSAQKPAPVPPKKHVVGWTNKQARELLVEAMAARDANDFAKCEEKDRASLKLEDHPYVKHHLAGCLIAQKRWAEAYPYEREALTSAMREEDADLAKVGTPRATEILEHVAHIKLNVPPKQARKIRIFVDDHQRDDLRVLVDPGKHTVRAEMKELDKTYLFEAEVVVDAKQEKSVDVVVQWNQINESELECIAKAKTLQEKQDCFTDKSNVDVHLGVEISAYSDTTNTHVFSPSASFALSSPTAGWNVGGSYLLDFVTAASPDIVSMASRHFRETRQAGTLGGSYKIRELTPQLGASVSSEPDYLSMTGSGSLSYEYEKWITPRVGYSFSRDRIGIRNTPFSQYERNLTTHEIEAGTSVIVNKTTVVVVGVSMQLLRGEQSKLYRFVPLFAPEVAATIQPGEPADDVNAKRLNVRPREVVPNQRDRYAISARYITRLLAVSTLRLEERLYLDTWGIFASTSDASYYYDLGSHLEVSGHARYHWQTGASFYQLAYQALLDDQGSALTIRPYRTGDRELSPMSTITGGLGARIALGDTEAKGAKYALVLDGDAMYSMFRQSLFVRTRTAVYGTVGFEVDF